jgi:hypothetical protein
MSVRVNETWEDRFLAQVDFAAAARREMQDIVVRAHCNKSAFAEGNGLGASETGINGPEIAVVEDEIGFGPLE